MKHRLSGAAPSVDDRAIAAAIAEAMLVGNPRRYAQQMSEH